MDGKECFSVCIEWRAVIFNPVERERERESLRDRLIGLEMNKDKQHSTALPTTIFYTL